MIYFINYALVAFGLIFCGYLSLSDRFNTKSKMTMMIMFLWVMLWLSLLFAAYPYGFQPVPLTTLGRTLALIINILSFHHIITNRCKQHKRRHLNGGFFTTKKGQ